MLQAIRLILKMNNESLQRSERIRHLKFLSSSFATFSGKFKSFCREEVKPVPSCGPLLCFTHVIWNISDQEAKCDAMLGGDGMRRLEGLGGRAEKGTGRRVRHVAVGSQPVPALRSEGSL